MSDKKKQLTVAIAIVLGCALGGAALLSWRYQLLPMDQAVAIGAVSGVIWSLFVLGMLRVVFPPGRLR